MKYPVFFFLAILLTIPGRIHAQNNAARSGTETGTVRWVTQYPSLDKAHKSMLQRLDELLFGSLPPAMMNPVSMAGDADQNICVLNQGNGVISRFGPKKSYDIKNRKQGPFPSLVSACVLMDRGIVFTDSYLGKAFLLLPENDQIRIFNRSDSLMQPTGIAYSKANDQVWIVETAAHRISVFDSDGSLQKTIGERGSGEGQFNFPTHLWIDELGVAYVVDAMNFRIQIFDRTGEFLSMFGKQGNSSGSMARPKGIATDSRSNIYIADALFNTIQIFNKQGDFLYYFGSRGSEASEFWMPSGIYIDEKDYIYVADSYNNRIQVFELQADD